MVEAPLRRRAGGGPRSGPAPRTHPQGPLPVLAGHRVPDHPPPLHHGRCGQLQMYPLLPLLPQTASVWSCLSLTKAQSLWTPTRRPGAQVSPPAHAQAVHRPQHSEHVDRVPRPLLPPGPPSPPATLTVGGRGTLVCSETPPSPSAAESGRGLCDLGPEAAALPARGLQVRLRAASAAAGPDSSAPLLLSWFFHLSTKEGRSTKISTPPGPPSVRGQGPGRPATPRATKGTGTTRAHTRSAPKFCPPSDFGCRNADSCLRDPRNFGKIPRHVHCEMGGASGE